MERLVIKAKEEAKKVNMGNFSEVCNELKQLYVGVTRPRKRLIIFDEDAGRRRRVEALWSKLGLVEVFKGDSERVQGWRLAANKANREEWKKQGTRMLRNKFYEQAMRCFEEAQDKELAIRARAYHLAEKAQKQHAEIDEKMVHAKKNNQL